MKVYLVYSYIILEDNGVFEPSGIVDYVAESLTDAICYMEECEADELSWWKVDLFEIGKDYSEDEYNGTHVGWYDHRVIKLEQSPYYPILEKMIADSNEYDPYS
jgi:hypothetical protein